MKNETANSNHIQDAAKAHVFNLIIVDESGSMGHFRQTTLSGVNETIDTIRCAQQEYADTQDHHLTLVTFSGVPSSPSVRTLIDCEPIGESVEYFSEYMPHGNTPLYDAMGQSLVRLHDKIKDDLDAFAVVTILTTKIE